MTYTVNIAGKSADRFRAYAATKLLRKPQVDDHIKRAEAKQPPLEEGAKIRYDGETIVAQGDVTGENVSFIAADYTITKVVFFKGPVETEAVVGSVDINAAGAIEIEIADAAAVEAAEPQIVDA
jgi:hypothetical protein